LLGLGRKLQQAERYDTRQNAFGHLATPRGLLANLPFLLLGEHEHCRLVLSVRLDPPIRTALPTSDRL
jgi:hypothetical protein